MSARPGSDVAMLTRSLGAWSAIAVVVGSTIGSGIFRTPAEIAKHIPEPMWFFAAWIVGGLVALAGALSFAELASLFPTTGGLYVYLREAWGERVAFLFGWAELLILRPAAYGAIALASAEYLLRALGIDGQASWLGSITRAQGVGAAMIIAVGVVNGRHIRWGALLQNVTTVLKIGALLGLIAAGAIWTDGASATLRGSEVAVATGWSAFGLAMVSVLWAYDGWGDVSFVSGEVRDPQRNLPKAFAVGTGTIIVLYLAVTAVFARVVPLSQMGDKPLVAADVAATVIGPAALVVVSSAIALSTFGTLNGSMMTGPRVFFAMAQDGLLASRLGRVDEATGTPRAAVALSVALGIVFVSVRQFAALTDQFVVGIWPFYGLGVLAVFKLRRSRPDAERGYRTWGYPVVPGLFLVATVFLLGNYMLREPVAVLFDVAIIAAGLPLYSWMVRRREQGTS